MRGEHYAADNFLGESEDDLELVASFGYGLVVNALEEAYDDKNDDAKALKYLEVSEPIIRALHCNTRLEDLQSRQEQVKEAVDGEDLEQTYDFFLSPGSVKLTYFYRELMQECNPDDFDCIVGVFAGGLPPMSVAGAYLEGEEVMVRYSGKRRRDEQVKLSETMEERLEELEDPRTLVVDDDLVHGRTIKKVGQHLMDRGISDVYAYPVIISGDHTQEPRSGELLKLEEFDHPQGVLDKEEGGKITIHSVQDFHQ